MAYSKFNSGGNHWRRTKDENFHGGSKPRSYHKNNTINHPLRSAGQQLSDYQLEESFCEAVGGISLQKVEENQRYMYQDEKIIQWKDSAAEAAFWNAKTRFWAKIHDQPCDIQLPDPDVFIDKIDWNSRIDPKLVADLDESQSGNPFEAKERKSGVVIGIPEILLESELMTPTGWGDAEDVKPPQRQEDNGVKSYEKVCPTGWDDENVNVDQDMGRNGDDQVNDSAWNSDNLVRESAWNHDKEHQSCAYDSRLEYGYCHNKWDDVYNQNKDSGSWNTSRYKISRYQHNTVQSDYHTRRSGQFSREGSLFGRKHVTRRW